MVVYDWRWLDLFADERHEIICGIIKEQGSVTTADLCKRLGVSIETVRKDLLTLELNNKLKRVHGGAVRTGNVSYVSLQERNRMNISEKHELSEHAAEFIKDGDVIFVDAGSTSVQFAKVLKRFETLTVVTYSLDVCEELKGYKNFELILCGGHFYAKENSFYGDLCETILKRINYNKAFLFPAAISIERGISNFSPVFAPMYRAVIERSDQVFILADSEKFESHAAYKAFDSDTDFVYVTDSKVPPDIRQKYAENGINFR